VEIFEILRFAQDDIRGLFGRKSQDCLLTKPEIYPIVIKDYSKGFEDSFRFVFKPILKFSHRTLIVTLECVVVVALVCALTFGLFVWNISQGPISVGWAKDYVEEALSNQEEQLSVKFDDMVFTWPDLKGPFQLDLKNLKVRKGGAEANSLSIAKASVGLSRGALLFGRIRPVSVIIQAPSLELVRTKEGNLDLFVRTETDITKVPNDEPKADPGQEIAQIFKDMATHKRGSFISRLDKFIIKDASVAVRDYQFGVSWYLTDLDFGIAEHEQGIAASLDVALPGGRDKEASLQVDMVYRKKSDDFRAAVHIQDINPYLISRFMPLPDILGGQDLYFSGDLESAMDTNLVPSYLSFKGMVPEGMIVYPEEFDAPISIRNLAVKAEYDSSKDFLEFTDLSGWIGGIPVSGEGRGKFTDNSMGLPIELRIGSVGLKHIVALFPKSEHDGEAYEWLGRNISQGQFSNVVMKMELTGAKTRNDELQRDEWAFDVPQMKLDFAFKDADVKYSDTLMPVSGGRGHGSLDLGTEILEIKGESASIGDLTGSDINVKVTDLMRSAAGYVTISLKAKGPMATALAYIAAEPINMGKEQIGIDAQNVKGTIEADLNIGLPTIKDVPKEQVKVDIKGTLTDIDVPGIVVGLPLSGGPLSLATEPGGFRIKGDAKLAGRATKMEWHQYFESAGHPYSMQVTASIGADQELRNHFGVMLDDYITGTMPVSVIYTNKGDGTSNVDVTGDLGPMQIHIDPFKFEKAPGKAGSITLKGFLEDDVLKKLTDIELKSDDLVVSGATIGFAPMNGKKADLSTGTLPSARIGKTQMNVSFDVTKDNVMQVKAKGPVFDLAPFLQETEASDLNNKIQQPKEKQQARDISLSADTMLGKDGEKIPNAKVYMETDTDGDITQLEMDGAVGKGKLFVRFKPDETGKRVFRLQTDDAGSVLDAFGLYENIRGGTLLIYGEPKGGDMRGDLFGSMRMENFRVVKAPALAQLLSLMSLSGVGQLLGNQGLVFSKLESNYEWRFRPAGNLLIIKDGKTSGSSVGLTFEGVVDRGKKTTDVSGTIIPMTEVNSLLASIPLIGDILGGSTGLIAATYTMKGPTSKPSVMVNPLSVLAPGFLRRILFEGGYESKIPDDPEPRPQDPLATTKKKVVPAKQDDRTTAPNASPKPVSKIQSKPVAAKPDRTAVPKGNQ